ncbi:MAG: radical SAM protein [Acidobacteriota bacterium]
MPPLGVLYLAAVLEQKGIDVQIVPADVLGYDWKQIQGVIADFRPDLLGVTTTTENRFDSFRLVREAKRANPTIKTILGGPHISMAKEDTMRHIPDVDFLAIGEGEETLSELCDALACGGDVSKVRGLYIRNGGSPIFTGVRPPIADLDRLPFPARHKVPVDEYRFKVTSRDGRERVAQNMMTSRGCPFNCYFCATPVNWGRRVRGYTPERILAEIEHLIEHYGAEFIWIYDDTFNYNPQRVHRTMDMIIERKLDIKFACEFRIDVADRPLLEKMVRAGLELAFFGIEAGSDRIRREVVHKEFSLDKAFQFLSLAKELGFIPNPFFIFSHHGETWSDAQETIRIIEEVKAVNPEADISTAILHVYPGTPLEEIARREGIIPSDFSWAKAADMKRTFTLPAAQGHVPLFKHLLSWGQIAELVVRWSATRKKGLSRSKILKVLKTVDSWKSFYIYTIFFLTMVKLKLKACVARPRTRSGDASATST